MLTVSMINLRASVQRKAQAGAKPHLMRRRALDQAPVVCAAAGLFGGVASALFGAVFTTAGWIVANEGARQWFSTSGTVLLFMTIPLLIIGGYCLDWMEKDKPRRNSKVAWQAYGTYVAPVGNGLTTDFGKFASSLGFEGNYTKDQINYSRSYLFNFLPYYHLGFRNNYAFNDKVNVTHYLVNGIGQSEDFNGFKSQAVLINIKPTNRVSWNVNYYTGIEGRDVNATLNPGFAPLPTQPGLSIDVIQPAPEGRTHIFDTYASWTATDKLTLAGQFDHVINRAQTFSAPSHLTGGAAYARYQLTPKVALAGRAEYLSDRGGLFSGVTQSLKETTLTFDYKLVEGVLMRGEWRRDFSNQPFFLTDTPGVLKKDQNTATLGLIWWFGKEGGW